MEWISIEDRLPKFYDYVIVFAKLHGTSEPCPTSIARMNPDLKWEFVNELNDVDTTYGVYQDIMWPINRTDITHWMPLPEAPKD